VSKAVDDRVVSLEFDNAQFEKSVNETLKMLEELKKSLKFDKAAENLSAITDAGKKVDLSTVGDSVDKLNEKFSTMRLVGLMALSNIVDAAMQMASKIGSILMAPFNQIKSGGWARAMKIEDAKFMLEGLQVQWDKIKDDINYGVADTAYGLDEAAKAASQLVASGVKFGETYGETGNSPMSKALRGISGVAAMTNSTYEEISSIFTTVAGQGKMMTMQLRQLEARGLNVAATMATQFNKVADGTSEASDKFQESVKKMTKGAKVTEATIRDLIQKGKVDFAIFSEAMDEAFGQHAKDANNTFTGALANVKAALSKIGAEFATPLIQDAIPVLNAVRKMINAIKTSMSGSGGIFDLFRTMSRGISNIFTSKIERITDFLNNRFTGLSNINRGLWIVMTNIAKIVKTIKAAFQSVFNGNTGDHINNMAVGFEKLAWALTPTDTALEGFGNVLKVILTIIKKVGEAIGWLISKLGGPLLVGFFKIINVIFTLIGQFGNLVSVIFEFVRGFGDADSSIKLLEERFGISSEKAQKFYAILNKVKDTLKKVGEVAKTALKYIAIGVAAIVVAPIYLLYQGFLKLTQMDWSKFVNALKNAKALIIEFFNAFKQSPIVQGALQGIETALGLVVGAVIYLGEKVVEFFNKLANGEITVDSIKEKIASIPDSLRHIGDKIGGFFKQNKFFSPVVDGLKKLGGKIKEFVSGLPELLKSLTPAKVMLITFSAAMVLLSVKANAVADVFVKLAGHLFKWYKIDSVLERKLNATLKVIGSFTQAILALTASIYILSKIPNLKETTIILGTFIGALATIGIIYTLVNRWVNGKNSGKSIFWQFSRDLTLMAVGVYLVSGALVKISDINLEGIIKKVGILIGTLTAIMGIGILFDNPKWSLVGTNGLATLLSMVGYAIAIYAVACAIKKLDGVDLSGLKGKWPELLAIIGGVALTARAIASIGIAVFAGAIAFFLVFRYVTQKMEELAADAENSTNMAISITERVKENLLTVGQKIRAAFDGILQAFEEDFWGTLGAFAVKVGIAILSIWLILKLLGKLLPAFTEVSRTGKYAKRAAKGFLTIAVAIAGLMLVTKYISDGLKDNPDALKSFVIVTGCVAALILMVGVLSRFVAMTDSKFGVKALKQVRRTFSSLALVFLSLAALMAVVADMSPEQFERAKTIFVWAMIAITALTVIMAVITKFSKNAPAAGFGTFAGITLLFATMLGSLALLMMMFEKMEDPKPFIFAMGTIITMFVLMSVLFHQVGKMKWKAAPKAIWAILGGMAAIAGVITLCAHFLPDEGVIEKVASITGAMILVMSAVVIMAEQINKYAKNTKYTVTKTSQKSIMQTLLTLAVLIGGTLVIAGALVMLDGQDSVALLAHAGVVVAVLLALEAMAIGLQKFSKNNTLDKAGLISTIAVLGTLTAIFAVLAYVMAYVSSIGESADRMLATSQAVVLVVFELSAITLALSKLSQNINGLKSLAAIPTILLLGVIFAALGVAMAGIASIGVSADRMLAVSQTVILCLAELAIMAAALGVLTESGLGLTSLAAIPTILLLGVIFAALGYIMADICAISPEASRMLAVSQVIMLVILELGVISAALGGLIYAGGIGVLSLLAIPTLILLVPIFEMLGEAIKACCDCSHDADRMLAVSQAVTLCLLELTVICGVLGIMGMFDLLAGEKAAQVLIVVTAAFKVLSETIAVLAGLNLTGDEIKNKVDLLKGILQSLIDLLPQLNSLSGSVGNMNVAGINALSAELVTLTTSLQGLQTLDGPAIATNLTSISEALSGIEGLDATKISTGLDAITKSLDVLFETLSKTVASGFDQFLTDMATTIANESLSQLMYKTGYTWGISTVEGFREGADWHSPPKFITKFFGDCGIAVNQSAEWWQVTKYFENTGYTWGTAISEAFSKKTSSFFGGADLQNMMANSSYNLGSITGINMENGLMPSLGSIQNALMQTLNLSNMVANSLNLASQGYMTTQTMYMDQLNHEYNTINRKLEASRENLAYWTKHGDQHEVDRLTKDVATYSNELYKVKDKMDALSGSTKEATEDTIDFSKALGGAGGSAKDFATSLQDTLESQMNIFSKFEQKSAMSKEELLGNMRSQIEGMTNWAAQMADLATKGIDKGLYEKLAMMGPQGAEYVGAFANMTAEELQEANTLWAQSLVLPGQAAAMVTGSFNSIGTNVVKGFANGITGNADLAINAVHGTNEEVIDITETDYETHSPSKLYERIGMFLDQGLANGIEKNQKRAIEAMEVMCQAIVMTAEKILDKDKFASFGMNIVDGLTEGLGDEEANKKLTNKIKAVSKSLQDTFKGPEEKGGNEIESPSKVFYRYGKYIDEGLANGISDYSGKVISSTENLSTSALDAMRYTVANIASMINDEMEDPVITPVLDLSNVQAGVRTLNSVLASNTALAAGISDDGTIQNGKSRIGGTTFIQNNYSPKALSRAEIYRQTNNQFARFRQSMG